MNISFHGACREVTGSCHLVETGKTKFLVDCGLFQGREFFTPKNLDKFDFNPKQIDFVLLTHAHLDHCGRLPKLYQEGFRGKIYATPATRDLAEVMLLDSARVIGEEAQKAGKPPMYFASDVYKMMAYFKAADYQKEIQITPEIKIRAREAGHILGSAIFEIWVKENGAEKKLVFSGDLGNPPAPIVKDTELVGGADYVFIESTYGGLTHEPAAERLAKLRRAVTESVGRGGVLMIPAFALERAQEILYELNFLAENGQIPLVPVFVDSPLAIKATAVYKKYAATFDAESRRLIEAGDDLFNFPGLHYTATVEASKQINSLHQSKVIIAGSGMCTGGRMPHHLKRYLSDPQSQLLIIAYQVEGSLGRRLLDGAKAVEIEGEKIKVSARVSAIGAYSSHADGPKLLNWLDAVRAPKPQKVFVIHGEIKNSQALAALAQKQLGLAAVVPEYGQVYAI